MVFSYFQFVAFIFLFAASVTFAVFGFSLKRLIAYFSSRDGKGALKGILVFAVGGGLIAGALTLIVGPRSALADEPVWFTYADVYLGLDYPKNISPQCEAGEVDEHLTSNGGVLLNVYRSADKRFHAGVRYTHHSCAFNSDRNGYDAFGISASYRFWAR